MAKISPFRAYHYNTQIIGNLSDVITPPYDVISSEDHKRYSAKSPYNFSHVDLAQKEGDDYSHSNELLRKWIEKKILLQDKEPSFYLYRQSFKVMGTLYSRNTLIGAVELSDFSEGKVLPHENTFGKHKADRLQLMRKTEKCLSHIFGMVRDSEGFLNTQFEKWEFKTPLLHAHTEDGATHSVWRIPAENNAMLVDYFHTRSIYIVDGHHRYESSLQYAKEVGALKKGVEASSVLFSIANAFDPALVVLPTHRVVSAPQVNFEKWNETFQVTEVKSDFAHQFTTEPTDTPQFICFFNNRYYLMVPRQWQKDESGLKALSVYWSDNVFLSIVLGIADADFGKYITYYRDIGEAIDKSSPTRCTIIHAPPRVSDVLDIADAGLYMPRKSTYFYPKLASGLILKDL